MSRRRVLVRTQLQLQQPPTGKELLEQLKAQSQALLKRISELSSMQSSIIDPRIECFESESPWRCRWCREEQKPKGLSTHERYCDMNPNRGTYTKR